jgi:hypothetical protein
VTNLLLILFKLKRVAELHVNIHVSGLPIRCYGLYVCVGSKRMLLVNGPVKKGYLIIENRQVKVSVMRAYLERNCVPLGNS